MAQAHLESDPLTREYWERGYIVLRGLFKNEEVAAWSAECDRLLTLDLVQPDNIRTPFRNNSGDQPERIDPATDISPVFAELAQDRRLHEVLEAIFRDKALIFKEKVIFKGPGVTGYTMHQDQAYWQLCPADDILSVSFQIDGASAANGGVELFSGYHGRMLTPVGVRTNFRPEELAQVPLEDADKIVTQPGDVLIFHSLTPHLSGVNTSDVWRRSLYLTYSAAGNGDFYKSQLENYKAYSGAAGQSFR